MLSKLCCFRCLRICKPYVRVIRHFLLVFCLALYTVFGAFIFRTIEEPFLYEQSTLRAKKATVLRDHMTDSFLAIHKQCALVSNRECRILLTDALRSYETALGLEDERNSSSMNDWNLWNSIFFASTVYTTIGYGHLTCDTALGKAATMVYALFGIPLLFLVIGDLGQFIYKHAIVVQRMLWRRLLRLYGRMRRHSTHILRVNSANSSRQSIQTIDVEPEQHVNLLLAVAIMLGFISLCAALLYFSEPRWSFFTRFYFVFVSLTTIGFGDYVPSSPQFAVFGFFLLIVGLSLTSLCVNALFNKYRLLYTKLLVSMDRVLAVAKSVPSSNLISPAYSRAESVLTGTSDEAYGSIVFLCSPRRVGNTAASLGIMQILRQESNELVADSNAALNETAPTDSDTHLLRRVTTIY